MLNVRERRALAAKREAVELLEELGLDRASRLLDVHPLTVKRWHRGEIVAPTPVLIALRSLTGRHAEENRDWHGWSFRNNFLVSPTNDKFHPGDLLGLRYVRQLQKYQERQIRLLREKLAKLQDGAVNDAIAGEILPQGDEAIEHVVGRSNR